MFILGLRKSGELCINVTGQQLVGTWSKLGETAGLFLVIRFLSVPLRLGGEELIFSGYMDGTCARGFPDLLQGKVLPAPAVSQIPSP